MAQKTVRIAEYRRTYDALLRCVSRDLPQTHTHAELMVWADRCRFWMGNLAGMKARTTADDREWAEKAQARAAQALEDVASGKIRRATPKPVLYLATDRIWP